MSRLASDPPAVGETASYSRPGSSATAVVRCRSSAQGSARGSSESASSGSADCRRDRSGIGKLNVAVTNSSNTSGSIPELLGKLKARDPELAAEVRTCVAAAQRMPRDCREMTTMLAKVVADQQERREKKQEHLQSLQRYRDKLRNDAEGLSLRIGETRDEIEELESQIAIRRRDIESMEADFRAAKEEVEQLTTDCEAISRAIQDHGEEVSNQYRKQVQMFGLEIAHPSHREMVIELSALPTCPINKRIYIWALKESRGIYPKVDRIEPAHALPEFERLRRAVNRGEIEWPVFLALCRMLAKP